MVKQRRTFNATCKTYNLAIHQHRFAAWAAARAAQRGLAANSNIIVDALDQCCVKAVVDNRGEWPATSAEFDAKHRSWCRTVLIRLRHAGIKRATYGRAAKVIAVYLKARVVLAGHHRSA